MIELTWAWLLHPRRDARDYETLPQHAESMLTIAALTLLCTIVRWCRVELKILSLLTQGG